MMSRWTFHNVSLVSRNKYWIAWYQDICDSLNTCLGKSYSIDHPWIVFIWIVIYCRYYLALCYNLAINPSDIYCLILQQDKGDHQIAWLSVSRLYSHFSISLISLLFVIKIYYMQKMKCTNSELFDEYLYVNIRVSIMVNLCSYASYGYIHMSLLILLKLWEESCVMWHYGL